jgi:hypothetical protein
MQRPPRILVLALVSAIIGLVFMANSFSGNNNSLINSVSNPLLNSNGLIPIANALKKDLMLDVSPQLHPSILVGESAKGIKFQHWIDNDKHCEDCLRLEIPNNGKKAGAAFSSDGAVYNFEGAKKIRFYAMGEEPGAKVDFKAVGNDKGKTTGGGMNNSLKNNNKNASSNDLFKDQEFALTSQNVTLNQTWSYFEMGLEGAQQKLSKVKYPFAFEVGQGKGKTTILYLKGISYSDVPVQDKYSLEPSSSNTTASTLSMTTATTALNVTLKDNATETVTAPATVEFNATVASGRGPYSFDWDFRDGAQEKDTDGNTLHTFATQGLYSVIVNVTDSLNNTGSANTMVDVAENLTQNSQTTTNPQNTTETTTISPTGEENQTEQAGNNDNSTSNSSNSTAAVNEEAPDLSEDRNTADSTASEPDVGNNSTEAGANGSSNGAAPSDNSSPVANAGADLVGRPNEKVILDTSKSTDPDPGGRIDSYQWEQESGPNAKIDNQSSPTPIVTLPDVDKDAKLVFSLTVNDGTVDSEKKDTVSIFVDYVKELTNNPQQKVLNPADIKASQWMPSDDCKDQDGAQCLSDGSTATFVAAGTETIDRVNLYSFGEFSEQGAAVVDPNSLVIERVVAEITAKKTGNTGYVSFAIDDPREKGHYFTPSLSIASSSFQKYNYVWDVNPVTGEKWTYDSLNSLITGFRYDGGQSGVQISELQLTVSYYLPEPSPPKDANTAQDTGDRQANEDKVNDENSTNSVEDSDQEGGEEEKQQQEPATETDNTNSTSADAEGEGTSSSEPEE